MDKDIDTRQRYNCTLEISGGMVAITYNEGEDYELTIEHGPEYISTATYYLYRYSKTSYTIRYTIKKLYDDSNEVTVKFYRESYLIVDDVLKTTDDICRIHYTITY
jgi:hypothetical protein